MIPGRLLASAYPAERNEEAHRLMTQRLIVDSSIEVIVNLMEEEELKSFTPYQAMMLEYAKTGLFSPSLSIIRLSRSSLISSTIGGIPFFSHS